MAAQLAIRAGYRDPPAAAVFLLVETAEGDTVGEISARGCVRAVSSQEALDLSVGAR